jgi:hypothetical protein
MRRKKKVDPVVELGSAPIVSKPISEDGFGFHSVSFTPLESPAARSGNDACSFISEPGV